MPYADKEAQRAYQREWWNRRRAEWIEVNGPCVRCGSDDDLQIDHVDPARKVSHKVWSWSPHRRGAELAKCQVLCGACHHHKSGDESRERNRQRGRATDDVKAAVTRRASGQVSTMSDEQFDVWLLSLPSLKPTSKSGSPSIGQITRRALERQVRRGVEINGE